LEVFIDAKIVQITLSDKFQLGVDWQYFFSKQFNIKGPNALNLVSGGKITFSNLDASKTQGGDAKIAVEALRTFGDTRVLSEPRLTVVNNQEAKILVGSKEPYVTTQISQDSTTAVTAETINFIDVGVKLYVTPTIARDGFVQMKIRPEVSSKTGTLTTAQKNEIPIVETSESETVLMVEDGGTVILGGLIKDEDVQDHQKIPVLGDIPLLGLPFRSTKDTVKRTELVIFLTPHIVTGRRGIPPAPPASAVQPVDGAGYYGWLMEMIQAVARTQPAGAEEGTVVVAFTLRPDGQLKGKPSVIQADSRRLADFAIRAVRAVAPFPPFPVALGEEPRQFRIPIRYVQAQAAGE
jgi:TonB family protein